MTQRGISSARSAEHLADEVEEKLAGIQAQVPDGVTVQVQRSTGGGDAQSPLLWGGAEHILLSLWGRADLPPQRDTVTSEWLAFGGN